MATAFRTHIDHQRSGGGLLGLMSLGASLLLLTACSDNTAPRVGPPTFGPWSAPVNLAGVNSPQVDSHPALSTDGLSLYFHSNRPGGRGGDDLYVVRRASLDRAWGNPVNLVALNSGYDERAPFLSANGRQLYFSSTRSGGAGGMDLYVSTRANPTDDSGWTAPALLGNAVNSSADDDDASIFEDPTTGRATLYFASNRAGGIGDFDVYSSVRNSDGRVQSAIIAPVLSSTDRETRAAIRSDGLELFLSSGRTGSERLDIWVFTRSSTAIPWSAGERLPPPVNSALDDDGPALSRDGRTLVFSSNRPGGLGQTDLYIMTRAQLSGAALKPLADCDTNCAADGDPRPWAGNYRPNTRTSERPRLPRRVRRDSRPHEQ